MPHLRYYQGETLGFRVLYVYTPADGIIFAVGPIMPPADYASLPPPPGRYPPPCTRAPCCPPCC
ncbi:hypothetical protein [uncultured Thiodictyon sp.]|uniref:hypothetical protein n=1 Tax=uncultured Thiodictyon sp. TaxID=1846217 RepID=UPI0025F949A6|nr:hypothetical protein [uncultured Thiodictyon sp.]